MLDKDSFQSFERVVPSSPDTVELANTIEFVNDNKKVYDDVTAEKESIFLFKDQDDEQQFVDKQSSTVNDKQQHLATIEQDAAEPTQSCNNSESVVRIMDDQPGAEKR